MSEESNEERIERERLDQIGWDDLFDLPEAVTEDPLLRRLHSTIVVGMTQEVAHLPQSWALNLLIERITKLFIVSREHERMHGVMGSLAAMKNFNAFWLDAVKEYNKMIKDAELSKYRKAMADVAGLIGNTLKAKVSDERLRDELFHDIIGSLEQMGI